VDRPGFHAFQEPRQGDFKKRWVRTIDQDVTELEGNPVKRPGKTWKRTSSISQSRMISGPASTGAGLDFSASTDDLKLGSGCSPSLKKTLLD
jgi:hypothetical protein